MAAADFSACNDPAAGFCNGGFCQHCATLADCAAFPTHDWCCKGACTAGSCTDGCWDGNESDVDCGGGTCPKCGPGKTCVTFNDCQSGVCVFGSNVCM
jgi:hypothetical protein